MSKDTTLLSKSERKNPRQDVNLFLQLKVSNDNSSKIESINLSSFEMQFLSRCYNVIVEIWVDNNHLGCAFYVWQKINSLLCILSLVLKIDSNLRVDA